MSGAPPHLPIRAGGAHCERGPGLVRGLAWHHRDPFDRLLIAQALDQGCTIVSRDAAFDAYGVSVLRA
jgi:hypothetical protein